MQRIILGSKSSSRQKIVTEMGLGFTVVSADIDEGAIGHRNSAAYANELVMSIATAKADHIMKRLPPGLSSHILLTADSVVTHKGKIFEKPRNSVEVRSNYSSFGEAPCSVVSAVVVTNINTGTRVQGVDVATVYFSPFTDDTVASLLDEGKVFNTAGGIMVEHPLVKPFVSRIEGNEDSIRGLPVDLTNQLLSEINDT